MTQRVSKPKALLDLVDVLPDTYKVLQKELAVPETFSFPLAGIDVVPSTDFSDPIGLAAFTMRKIQLLYRIAHPGVLTTNDIVVGLCQEIVRALRQLAPRCSPAADETLQRTYKHLVSCGTVVSTLVPGELAELH